MKTPMYCYLESKDKTVLPERFDSWFAPESTAVLCIDMHRGHCGDDPDATCPAPIARERIPQHDEFHRACRALGIPVIMVQHWQRYGGIDDVASKRTPGGTTWRWIWDLTFPDNYAREHSWEGTKWLELSVETEPTDYYVRTKKRLSSFYATDLEHLLRQLDVRNLVLTGTLTDCCILSTTTTAADLDYRVLIPRDIVAPSSDQAGEAALLLISLYFGLVTDSAALLAEWQARKG